MPDCGSLYLCGTPIGNLDDVTLRTLEVLRSVDCIAAEDTRHTAKLLRHHSIATPTVSYHDHNEAERASELVRRMKAGESVALVSDAGTPGISDPGYTLIKAAIESGIRVVPLPGASAFLTALVASGLPPHPFYFGGFLPRKSSQRQERLRSLASLDATLVFYEAPHRLGACLRDVSRVFPGRDVVVARELTKKHEEFVRGAVEEVLERFEETAPRGECVLLIDGKRDDDRVRATDDQIEQALREALRQGKTKKEAVRHVASLLEVNRNRVYDSAIRLSTAEAPIPPD